MRELSRFLPIVVGLALTASPRIGGPIAAVARATIEQLKNRVW